MYGVPFCARHCLKCFHVFSLIVQTNLLRQYYYPHLSVRKVKAREMVKGHFQLHSVIWRQKLNPRNLMPKVYSPHSCLVILSNSFATPWTVACQPPLSMGFPRQEYWSRLPFPSPGDLSAPGIKSACPALVGRLFTTEPPGRPMLCTLLLEFC